MKTLQSVLLLCLAASHPAAANVLFTNLGPGDSYNTNLFDGYVTANSANPFSVATDFTATATGSLGTLLLPISDDNGYVSLGLYTDSSGQPGTLLEGWTDISVPTTRTDIPLLSVTSLLNPVLSIGITYWLVVTSPATISPIPPSSPALGWDASNQVSTGGIWVGNFAFPTPLSQAFPDSPAPAIELEATPEPATWIMLACGLIVVVTMCAERGIGYLGY